MRPVWSPSISWKDVLIAFAGCSVIIVSIVVSIHVWNLPKPAFVEKIVTPVGECWRVVNDKDSFTGYTRWNCPEGVRL